MQGLYVCVWGVQGEDKFKKRKKKEKEKEKEKEEETGGGKNRVGRNYGNSPEIKNIPKRFNPHFPHPSGPPGNQKEREREIERERATI